MSTSMHSLLARQLKKCFGNDHDLPAEIARFVAMVDDAYEQSDSDRRMLERSMELSSRELLRRNTALAAAEQKYRAIFENVTEGIFQSTPDGKIISANPALARICGYDSAAQMLVEPHNDAMALYVQPGRRDEIIAILQRDGTLSNCESQWRRRDGSIIWVSATVRIATGPDGSTFFEGSVRDISKRKHAEDDREALQDQLIRTSRQAGMAEVATGVLHNVGNVLNSVNVSAKLIVDKLQRSEIASLSRLAAMIVAHKQDIGQYLTTDDRGKLVPDFIVELANCLAEEQHAVLAELASLHNGIDHIKQIVIAQQSLAKSEAVLAPVAPAELVEAAVTLQGDSFARHQIELVRQIAPMPNVMTDQHKVVQILVNLLSNARHAVKVNGSGVKRITIGVSICNIDGGERLRFEVSDTGIGIRAEHLTSVFAHGFTTKEKGHGFGLHSSANAAKELDGTLSARSDGIGRGATFVLDIPFVEEGAATCRT